MKTVITLSIVLAAVMSSCYFVDDIFDPPSDEKESLQSRCESAISNYIKTTTGETYSPYGFGSLTIHKTEEIIELEKLESEQKVNPSAELDSAVAQQKRYVEENKLGRTLDLDHFFTLTDSTGLLKIFETNFILNDSLQVTDLSAKIMLRMDGKYEETLSYFFFEYNIFMTSSYYESRNLSNNFYAFFKDELEKRSGLTEKSDFLRHSLKLVHEIKAKGAFDQQAILEDNVQVYLKEKRKDIKDYEYLKFSELYQKQEENSDEITGYYFFHKFIGNYLEQVDTNVIMIEFSPYYEITSIFQMDRPFDVYFKN